MCGRLWLRLQHMWQNIFCGQRVQALTPIICYIFFPAQFVLFVLLFAEITSVTKEINTELSGPEASAFEVSCIHRATKHRSTLTSSPHMAVQ